VRACVAAAVALVCSAFAPAVARADMASSAQATGDVTCASRSDAALAHPAVRLARIVGDPTTTPSDWRRADANTLDRIAHDPDIYSEVADVWRVDGRIAIVNIESRSLDYREDASYCFRADGSLARIESTSSGTINIDDEARYFDGAGNVVATSSKLRLLYPAPNATVSPDLRAAKPAVYLHVDTLPFFSLIGR
jgi:hypothetical protein